MIVTIFLTSGRQLQAQMDADDLADALKRIADPLAVLHVSLPAMEHFIPSRQIEDIALSK